MRTRWGVRLVLIALCAYGASAAVTLGSTPGTTLARAGGCPPVQNTPSFTIAFGTVKLDGSDAPVDSVVEARSPRGDTVGCFEVTTAGHYGFMYVYGQDSSVQPPIPGMRADETVTFYVNGSAATVSPELVWHDDRDPHEVAITGTTPAGLLGDVNDDAAVDSTDALIILSADVGFDVSPFCPMNCGDTNADGVVDSTDALIVLSYDVGFSIPFPVGEPGCPASITQPPGCNL